MSNKLVFNFLILTYLSTIASFAYSLNDEKDVLFADDWNSLKDIRNRSNIISPLALQDCGLSHTARGVGNKIVGGRDARPGEFPWHLLLKITDLIARPFYCGGSMLNERWVLTAAHCVSSEIDGRPTARKIEVTAGLHHRKAVDMKTQVKFADCVIQHQNWEGQNGQFLNDIALVRISSKDPFEINYRSGGTINTICLPPKKSPPFEYTGSARISGWGLTKERGTPSDVLKYTDVTILDNKVCKKFEYPVPIVPSMMCQGVDRRSPCQGDSGGPLIVFLDDKQPATQIGIVSFGPGQCANAQVPNAIYTKTSYYREWIEDTIIENENDKCSGRALILPEEIPD